jgi:acyl-homoserine lactone acylase PvdQ
MAEIDPKALARDRDVRKLGYTEVERQQRFDQLTPRHQLQIKAYIDGVNAWMTEATASGKLPEGYAQNQIKPAPFRVTDSIAISDLMSQRFGSGGGAELRNQRYLNKLKNKFGAETSQQENHGPFGCHGGKHFVHRLGRALRREVRVEAEVGVRFEAEAAGVDDRSEYHLAG